MQEECMKRIVAWVDRYEKKTLVEANLNNNSIHFAKNQDNFVENLTDDVFPVISVKKAHKINTLRQIVRAFPALRFYALARLDGEFTTPNEFSFIIDEPNVFNPSVRRNLYVASEIISLFESQYTIRA
jgi:hypothetical protein